MQAVVGLSIDRILEFGSEKGCEEDESHYFKTIKYNEILFGFALFYSKCFFCPCPIIRPVSIREMQKLRIWMPPGKRGKRAKGLKPLGSVWNNIKGSVRDRDRRLKEKKAKLARKGRKKECIVHREK